MDWDKLATEIDAQARFQGEWNKDGDEDYKRAAALAAQQTLYGLAQAIREALKD